MAGQILTFDFGSLAGSEVSANSNFNDSNISSSTITRGSGVTASGNGGRFNGTSWTTSSSIGANDYLEFTITPNMGFQINVSSIDINHQRSGTGPTAFELRSSIDSYASDIATFSISDVTSTQSNTFGSLGITNQSNAVTFRIYAYEAEGGGGSWGPGDFTGNDIIVNGSVVPQGPTVGFDSATSSETETDATFTATIPVTLSNYGGSQVDLSVAVTGGTAEMADYTLNTTSLVFMGNGTQNISIDINPDAGTDDETIEITLTETTSTGISISPSVHTITLTDDDIPQVVINEILADPDSGTGDANGDGSVDTSEDEFVEIYNLDSNPIDLEGWTLSDGVGVRHTFPAGTILDPNEGMVVFGGGTPTGFAVIAQTASSGSLGLNNGGDDITIETGGGLVVTSVSYGSEGGNNEALARSPDFTGAFVAHSSIATNPVDFSPGKDNTDNTNLPINLISFNAQKIKQQVALSWETAAEINNDYMAVERSQDGRTFVEIGRVQGAGTTTTPQNYRFIDEAPLAGVNYYRLRQVDFDGRTEYHQVVSVNMGGATSSIRILPNPVNDFTSLQLDQAFEQDTQVRIYDLTGRVVFANNWAAGQQQLDLNLSFLANGSYVIRIENQEEIITERFVKQ